RPLRGAGVGFIPESDLPRRAVGRYLWPVPSARERIPRTGPLAELRHRVPWAALRCSRAADTAGAHDGVPERHSGTGRRRADRTHRESPASTLCGGAGKAPPVTAGPRQRGALPQHLDQGAARKPLILTPHRTVPLFHSLIPRLSLASPMGSTLTVKAEE